MLYCTVHIVDCTVLILYCITLRHHIVSDVTMPCSQFGIGQFDGPKMASPKLRCADARNYCTTPPNRVSMHNHPSLSTPPCSFLASPHPYDIFAAQNLSSPPSAPPAMPRDKPDGDSGPSEVLFLYGLTMMMAGALVYSDAEHNLNSLSGIFVANGFAVFVFACMFPLRRAERLLVNSFALICISRACGLLLTLSGFFLVFFLDWTVCGFLRCSAMVGN